MGSDIEFGWEWVAGVLIYLVGTTAMSLGANLQRYSMQKNEVCTPTSKRNKSRQPLLITGFVLMTSSGIFLSVALIFASQTQLAPLILFIFVSNCFFAHHINHEKLRWRSDGVATVMISVGVIACVVAAPKENHTVDQDQFLDYFATVSFICYMSLLISYIIAVWAMRAKILRDAMGDWSVVRKANDWKYMALNLSYGSLAGALGALNITLTKTTFSLIGGQYEDDGFVGIFTSPMLYIISAILVCTYITQMKCTVEGLEQCSAMIVVSATAVTEEVAAIMGGVCYFQDYTQFETWSAIVFGCGNAIAIFGVLFLTHYRLRTEKEETELLHETDVQDMGMLGTASELRKGINVIIDDAGAEPKGRSDSSASQRGDAGQQSGDGWHSVGGEPVSHSELGNASQLGSQSTGISSKEVALELNSVIDKDLEIEQEEKLELALSHNAVVDKDSDDDVMDTVDKDGDEAEEKMQV